MLVLATKKIETLLKKLMLLSSTVIKLLKMARSVRALLDTVMQSFPEVGNLGLLFFLFFFSSRGRHTRSTRDWSSDVCSSDLSGTSVSSQKVPQDQPAGSSWDGSGSPGVCRRVHHRARQLAVAATASVSVASAQRAGGVRPAA